MFLVEKMTPNNAEAQTRIFVVCREDLLHAISYEINRIRAVIPAVNSSEPEVVNIK
jgi:hypothetical protein